MKSITGRDNPFRVEELRASLAKKRRYKELLKTYTNKYPEIPDLNTPTFWDAFNTHGKRGKNPMDTDRIKTVVKLIKGNTILNIGFGSASLEKKYFADLHEKNFIWHAIDISPASVKKAKKELPHGKFKLGNIISLHYQNNSFDCVVALEVLEHIRPTKTFQSFKEIFRVIKPGGYFIVSVPLNECLEQMIRQHYNPNAHVRIYTPELIKAELAIAGFTVEWEKQLFAFHHFYTIKSLIANLMSKKFLPNNIILVARRG